MSNCFTSLLLAVVAFVVVVAHGKTLYLRGDKDNVTSQGEPTTMAALSAAAAAASGPNVPHSLDKTKDERETSSAVQDWSLVCQQLCGAALGGAACIPYCGNVTTKVSLKVQLANADILMASGKQQICPKLCGLQLGDAVCTCKKINADDKVSSNDLKEATNVCAIFCDATHVTLTGCSPCIVENATATGNMVTPITTSKVATLSSIKTSKEDTASSITTSKGATVSSIKSSKEATVSPMKTSKEATVSSIKSSKEATVSTITTSKEATVSPNTTPKGATVSPITTSKEATLPSIKTSKSVVNESTNKNATATNAARATAGTTTTATVTATATTTTTSETTTPNWKELCAALCKTGDGGSLCNCNLSPFMM